MIGRARLSALARLMTCLLLTFGLLWHAGTTSAGATTHAYDVSADSGFDAGAADGDMTRSPGLTSCRGPLRRWQPSVGRPRHSAVAIPGSRRRGVACQQFVSSLSANGTKSDNTGHHQSH